MMCRTVLLRGRNTGCAFVYAETSIAPARIPPPVRRALERSRDPIGRILSEHALVGERELLPGRASADHADATIAVHLAAAPLSRRYRILLGSGPAFAVDEWFLQPAADALSRPHV
jgi:chorismate-pyruvate lyase